MRRLFTTEQALRRMSKDTLRWGERVGRWTRIDHGVYGVGPEPPSELDRQRARVLASRSPASGALAGVLLGFDGVELDERPTRRRSLPPERIVVAGGVPCVDATQAMLDLAGVVDDLVWEQALESALRRRLTSIAAITRAMAPRSAGNERIRRVLEFRPPGAPPTESLLETLMVQLVRTVPGLGPPTRQLVVRSASGTFIARVDLAWPELGLFHELDGQGHKGQPVYDAVRETAVVAATGWLCGRFTWYQVVHIPRVTARQLDDLAGQARRRPLPAA